MAQKPIQMELIKNIFQLHHQNISIREIARRLGISRNSARKYLRLLPAELPADKQLAECAYGPTSREEPVKRHRMLIQHFAEHAEELSQTGVTRRLLWTEYLLEAENGYGYSQYCYHLKKWLSKHDLAMHLEYSPGDLMMADYAGKKQRYINPDTGEIVECEVFISVLPYSGLIFCKAIPSQKGTDLADVLNDTVAFYGGISSTVLFDNTKTLVTKCDRYEPVLTDLCHQLSAHYQATFTATRPYSPRDKAMVEKSVNIVYNHIYGPMRHQTFKSLKELNTEMHRLLQILNEKPYKNTPYSRKYFFDQYEKEKLRAVSTQPFRIKKAVALTVQRNYHVQIRERNRYYSVPYAYVGKRVMVYYDSQSVEIYYNYERIALHQQRIYKSMYHTHDEHMPPNHQAMKNKKGWTKESLLKQATELGSSIGKAAELILDSNFMVEQNYKSCYGMMMLKNKYTVERLEAACGRALQGTRVNYTMIKNILERGLDKQKTEEPPGSFITHGNIRGKENYT
jgi:transposase